MFSEVLLVLSLLGDVTSSPAKPEQPIKNNRGATAKGKNTHRREDRKPDPAVAKPGHENPSTAPIENQSSADANQGIKAADKRTKPIDWSFIIPYVTLGLSGAAVFFAWRQARINKSSGRSLVTVEVQHLQSSAREINGDPVRFGVSLICSNGGKIPAEIREIRAVLKPFNTDAIPRKSNLSEAKIFTRQTPLANGTTAALVKEVFTCACKEDVLGDVVLFYGVIKYRDNCL